MCVTSVCVCIYLQPDMLMSLCVYVYVYVAVYEYVSKTLLLPKETKPLAYLKSL